jgi:short-subunit dehydrogenase
LRQTVADLLAALQGLRPFGPSPGRELAGRRAVVTGSTSGIGRATALRLAGAGAKVVCLGRDPIGLDEIARETSGMPVRADLSDPGDIDLAVQEALAGFGRVDVLVNNAGQGWAGPFADQDVDGADYLVRVNLIAPIRLTRAFLPGMLERGRGAVVNVSSIAGHVGVRGEAVYASTKAGLIGFSESLRYELRGTGITVTVVSPGVVGTAFFDHRGRPYDRRHPRPIPPQRVAATVFRAIRSGRPQLFVPGWMAFPARLRGTWPRLYRWLHGRFS